MSKRSQFFLALIFSSQFSLTVLMTIAFDYLALAQTQSLADSLRSEYVQNDYPDSVKLRMLKDIAFNEIKDLPLAVSYSEELIRLANLLNKQHYLRSGFFIKGTKQRLLGNLDDALSSFFKSATIASETQNPVGEAESYCAVGDIYSGSGNHDLAMPYYHKAIKILRSVEQPINLASVLSNAGDELNSAGRYDSALTFFDEAKNIFEKAAHKSGIGYTLGNIGMVYANTGKHELARTNMNEAIRLLEQTEDYYPISVYLLSIADIYDKQNDKEEALKYALESYQLAKQFGLKEQVAEASLQVSDLYNRIGSVDEAFNYYKIHVSYRDSLQNVQSVQRMAELRSDYEISQKQLEVDLLNRQKQTQRILVVALVIILLLALLILFLMARHDRQQKKNLALLAEQKLETELARNHAETALIELKNTQKLLIQTAKMASLGELTAGVAHEIQNPLNFVTNFSDLSVDLLNELKQVVGSADEKDRNYAAEIIGDIGSNLQKVVYHGKRADAIVKGMLQHSGNTSGTKEAIDLNKLVKDAYALSNHSMKKIANEISLEVEFLLDPTLKPVKLVPQDFSRVIINLLNNGYYSMIKKWKEDPGFQPHLTIQTGQDAKGYFIKIKDNGLGVSTAHQDKIFQPFFTTKPTGEGTGLGLSLSYDIVQAHNGQISLDSVEGEYAEFIINLPA